MKPLLEIRGIHFVVVIASRFLTLKHQIGSVNPSIFSSSMQYNQPRPLTRWPAQTSFRTTEYFVVRLDPRLFPTAVGICPSLVQVNYRFRYIFSTITSHSSQKLTSLVHYLWLFIYVSLIINLLVFKTNLSK